jgi:hypothetical protein
MNPLFVPHADFVRGLPAGQFKVIVNPELARPWVRGRLLIVPICLTVAGLGTALALAGHPWWGLGVVAFAVLLNRAVRLQAPQILLYLATQSEPIYLRAMEQGLLEVQAATLQA